MPTTNQAMVISCLEDDGIVVTPTAEPDEFQLHPGTWGSFVADGRPVLVLDPTYLDQAIAATADDPMPGHVSATASPSEQIASACGFLAGRLLEHLAVDSGETPALQRFGYSSQGWFVERAPAAATKGRQGPPDELIWSPQPGRD